MYNNGSPSAYLNKPTGNYKVGFKDYYFPNKHATILTARVYYPASNKDTKVDYENYYHGSVNILKSILNSYPTTSLDIINENLNELRSHTINVPKVATDKKFPVLLFNPAFAFYIQLYENIIADLVSHGYIVIGINSLTVNGDITLPNGTIVKTVAQTEKEKFIKQSTDSQLILDELKDLSSNDEIFKQADINNIGIIGALIGGATAIELSTKNPNTIKAVAAIDPIIVEPKNSIIITIPVLNLIDANFMMFSMWPPREYDFKSKNYLVTVAPTEKEIHYSQMASFSDFSTLQYIPIINDFFDRSPPDEANIDISFLSHVPTIKDCNEFSNPNGTYIFTNINGRWSIVFCAGGTIIPINKIYFIQGLRSELKNLSKYSADELSADKIFKLKKIMQNFHDQRGKFGSGNGYEIIRSVNKYLLAFFDEQLKGDKSVELNQCKPLTENSIIRCY